MTITLVLSSPPGYSETFFNSKIKGLQENGHKVILVTASTQQQYEACIHVQHPKVYRNPLKQVVAMLLTYLGLLPYFKRILRYIRLEREQGTSLKRLAEKLYLNATLLKLTTDWLHFGFATMALERELLADAIHAKMAVSFRGYDIGVYPLKHPGCYKLLWSKLDKVHYISDDLYAKAIELGLPSSIPHQKITPAIDTGFFDAKSLDESLNDHEIDDVLHICTIGRLHWKKGYVETLKALQIVKKQGVNFKYHIIGDGDEYERIAFAAYQFDLTEDVIFEGKVEHQQVKDIMVKCKIYLQYSIQEGFCNAVLEAQAMGKLCIVSDAEGLSENVLDNKTGWVVPKLNPEALAQKIQDVIHLSNDVKKDISKKAVRRVQQEFNLEKQKRMFNEFYNK